MTKAKRKGLEIDYASTREEVLRVLEQLKGILLEVAPERSEVIAPLLLTLHKPLFSVAVTGSSRSGKSTLINAMLSRDISPIGPLPTTGIPCIYEPASEEAIEISLTNGEPKVEPVTKDGLALWVTQTSNPDNEKGVTRIRIRLKSEVLGLGLSILDLPGLDDPSDNIRNLAEMALEASDAIVYLISGDAYKEGSFIFTRYHRDDLQRLVSRKDKTFVLVNKADTLTLPQQAELRKYLIREFERFKLLPLSQSTLFFVSAETAFRKRCLDDSAAVDADFEEFEAKLWDYLVKNSRVGRNRLSGTLSEAAGIVADQVAIATIAIAKSEKSLQLRSILSQFPGAKDRVVSACARGYDRAFNETRLWLRDECDRAVRRVEVSLRGIPWTSPLPSRREMRDALEQFIVRMAVSAQQKAQAEFQIAAEDANEAVRALTSALREEIGMLAMNDANLVVSPNLGESVARNPWTPFWGTLGLGLAGAVFGPIGIIVGGIIGLLLGLFADDQRRHQREVDELVARSTKILYDATDRIADHVDKSLDNAVNELQAGLLGRLDATEASLRAELDNVGAPLQPGREALIRKAIGDLKDADAQMRKILSSLATP